MHIRNTKISKALALLAAGLVVASFTINNAAFAGTLFCVIETQGGTGCQAGPNCPFYEPNQGLLYDEHENCTYALSPTRLLKDQLANDCWHSVSGCCNNIDLAQYCPSAGNCPKTSVPEVKCTYTP